MASWCIRRSLGDTEEGRVSRNVYYAKSAEYSYIAWATLIYVYAHHAAALVLVSGLSLVVGHWLLSADQPQLQVLVHAGYEYILSASLKWWFVAIMMAAAAFVLLPPVRRPVLLMGFEVFEPPSEWKKSHDEILQILANANPGFTPDSIAFMRRIIERSGTGPSTAFPPALCLFQDGPREAPPAETAQREEAQATILPTVQSLFDKLGLKPTDIDFLIVNCSLFAPTPSLAGLVQHHFQMRHDVKAYNLSGMGCAAGVTSIDLARQLLQSSPNSRCLVISTEVMGNAMSRSNERSFLVQNTLFRVGCAAMVLSNRLKDWLTARYELEQTMLTHDASDSGYNCVFSTEDTTGTRGVRLSRDIVEVAGRGLTRNLTRLGPLVLPLSEQLTVLVNVIQRWVCKRLPGWSKAMGLNAVVEHLPSAPKPYMPDWKGAVQHFCIHAGGRAVIDGIEKNLKLTKSDTAPSRAALYQFGNTSSSSIWYELKFVEQGTKRWVPPEGGAPIQPGERVLQVGFGSGFKCQSCVWRRLR